VLLGAGVNEVEKGVEQAMSQAAALSQDVLAASRGKEGLESEVRAWLGRLQLDVEAYMKKIGGR
jgi:hypothetical protein